MQRLVMGLSERNSIAARAARLMVSVCLLLCVSSAAVTSRASSAERGSDTAIAMQTGGGEAQQAEIRELKQGQPIVREMAGVEAHTYRIALTAGHYLKVVVEQKGIDVVVTLLAPNGQKLTEVDSPNGTQGPEPVSVIAEVSGEYRLEVRSLDEKAPPGRYEIKVEELREPTAQDRIRVAADMALAEAGQLRAQGTAESLRKAIDKYSQALPALHAMGDRESEATTLTSAGVVSWQLGENQKALEFYNLALPLRRSAGDRQGEVQLLHNMGVVYWRQGDNRKALEYYNQALPLRRALGDRQGEALTLNSIGMANDNLGNLQEALSYFDQSLALQRSLGDRRNEATTLNNIGASYYALGELQKSLEFYNQSLVLERAVGDRRGEGALLNNIGVLYWQLGEPHKAIEYYNQALALRHSTGDRPGEFATIANIGQLNLSLGRPQLALDNYGQALALARAMGDRRSEALALNHIGAVYRSLNQQEKALDFLNQALLLRRAVGDRFGEAVTLSHIGASYSLLGKPEEALSYLEQALSEHRAVGDRGNEASTLRTLAQAERDRGRLDEARAHTEVALRIIESARGKFTSQELRTSFSASRQDYYEFYVDLLMRMHRDQPQSGYDADALKASDQARARGLLDILTEAHADIRQGIDSVQLEHERSLLRQLSLKSERLTRLLGGKHAEEQETSARKEVEDLLGEYQEVEAQIRVKSPRYAGLTQPQPLSLKEIQQQVLDKDTLLLEYSLGEDRSYLWAVTPTSIASYELPKRAEIEAAARRVYDLLVVKADSLYPEALTTLSQMLLKPVADQLGRKRLLIVSEGALQYVPFGALPIPVASGQLPVVSEKHVGISNNRPPSTVHRPLIVDHEIVSLPSASVLAILRRELGERKPAPKTVAVLADPVFDKDDQRVKSGIKSQQVAAQNGIENKTDKTGRPSDVERSIKESGLTSFDRLLLSRREAEVITALASRGLSLEALDFTASRATATSAELEQYQIVHFATHSLLNNQHPELSGIVLSLVDEQGQPQDGFLRLYEIYNLKLGADLVVLSACQTALGKEIKGEGLVGLTRGFMYAGVPRVVASLWKVNDKSTAELMKRFYQKMLKDGMRPAAALRAAQVSMLKEKQWEAPYYWAGFVLQGEWR